jgi:1-deoxy-D-xylulose-5-phosphate reductoisomerase
VDSEHNALHQCLRGEDPRSIKTLWLTASGGPLREVPLRELASVTPERALAHPTWVMGRKITIDSATLMNKGLEVIEARWLFDVGADRIKVLIHPKSIVHSLVEFADGSWKAQLGSADMRHPIQYALTHPQRLPSSRPPFDLLAAGPLAFEARTRALSLPAARLRGPGTRWGRARCAQRGQRGRRGGVPRAARGVARHPRRDPSSSRAARRQPVRDPR